MKTIIKTLTTLSILIAFVNPIKASHMLGGEITYECLNNGQYVFYMDIYFDCSGIAFGFNNEQITISTPSGQLPKNSNGATISSIIVKPDSSRWMGLNNGDISPSCSAGGTAISCPDLGAWQVYTYKSDPITFTGVPTGTSLDLAYNMVCCRGNYDNISANGSSRVRLKTQIFSSSIGSNYTCEFSSARFAEVPTYFGYTNQDASLSSAAFNFDADSLIYSFDSHTTNESGFVFNSNFGFNQLTPGTQSHAQNKPIQIDRHSGQMDFKVMANSGEYVLFVKVNSYRGGQLLNTVYREMPIHLYSPAVNQNLAEIPNIPEPFTTGNGIQTFYDTVLVGSLVSINSRITDTNTVNGNPQTISLRIMGENIAADYSYNGNCVNPNDSNCAFLQLVSPVLDSRTNSYQVQASSFINSRLKWQTDCSDLSSTNGPKTHYFVYRAQDDLCPIPGVNYKTIAVTVIPDVNNPCQLATAIEEQDRFEQLKLYPNPTADNFKILLPNPESFRLTIKDIQGKTIHTQNVNHQSQLEVNLEGPAGIYFVELLNENGLSTFRKLIKYNF